MNFYDTQIKNKLGEFEPSSKYKGKVVLIVNTASNCGLAPQFTDLEELHQKYKDYGLEIIGIPSNTFKQEISDGFKAEEVCKINYGVTFKIMDVVDVNGKNQAEIFKFLKSKTKRFLIPNKILWNFEKFLIDKKGEVYKRYRPTTKPLSIEEDIKRLLDIK